MLLKGTRIGISGELANRPYTAKDGTDKFSLDLRVNDVTLLGKPTGQISDSPIQQDTLLSDDFEDDIPF